MTRRLPLVATAVVAIAVATMVAMGVWQLQRAQWKADLLARYRGALSMSSEVPFPTDPGNAGDRLYRRSRVDCESVLGLGGVAGRNDRDQAGWAQTARCATPAGEAEIALGWSRNPNPPDWDGGRVQGVIAPAGQGVRLVASPPQAGLDPLAAPDPGDLPDNHLAYAVQWFFFAATALVIYALALRKRRRGRDGE